MGAKTATTPGQTEHLFIEAIHAGDVDAALAVFEEEGVLHAPNGKTFEGHEQIRGLIEFLLKQQPRATSEVVKTLEAAGVALFHTEWTLTGNGSGGERWESAGQGAHVARKQPDGSWKLVILNRPGTASAS